VQSRNWINNKYPPVYNRGISEGWKWWQTVLATEVSCSQWEGSAWTQSALLFSFKFWRGGGVERRISFIFPLFPTGSQCIPQACSQYHLALIPYIWAKGEALHLSIGSSILGSLQSLNFSFCDGPIKFNQKKLVLWEVKLRQKWWWTLLGRQVSCSDWEGISMHSRCVAFIPFKLSAGQSQRRIFFPIFPGSHYVPFNFPISSHPVPEVLNVFPTMFSIAPHLYLICFGKCCPPFTYIGGPKGRNSK